MNRKIQSAVQTDIGRKREENEDNFVWIPELWSKPGMALVGAIDGVGGYEGGAEAAQIARTTIENYFNHFSFGPPSQLLREAVVAANNQIHEKRTSQPDLNRMSCVLTAAILDADKEMMYIGHIGDSRGYVYRDGEMLKLTKDHSTVGQLEDKGYLTEEEAMHHPRRNEINKMLGDVILDPADTDGYIEMSEHSFLPGDIALFCSDGLTDLVNRAGMAEVLGQDLPLKEKLQLLIDRANEAGGKDNITVALATYTARKSDQKKIYKRAIEVPIQGEEKAAGPGRKKSRSGKKKLSLIWIAIALVAGFVANWWGTKSLIAPVIPNGGDSLVIKRDSTPVTDSLSMLYDSLRQATDTIRKDSVRHQTTGH